MIKSDKSILKSYTIRRLRKDETIKSFDCGDDDLNDFIWNRAESYNKALLSVTYVFEHKNRQRLSWIRRWYKTTQFHKVVL